MTMTEEDEKIIRWAAEHLGTVKLSDVVPKDGYGPAEVYWALVDADAPNLPAATDEITLEGIHGLAASAQAVLAREGKAC